MHSVFDTLFSAFQDLPTPARRAPPGGVRHTDCAPASACSDTDKNPTFFDAKCFPPSFRWNHLCSPCGQGGNCVAWLSAFERNSVQTFQSSTGLLIRMREAIPESKTDRPPSLRKWRSCKKLPPRSVEFFTFCLLDIMF